MFDHEKLDVYRLELKFLVWATEFLVELASRRSPVNRREFAHRCLAPKGRQDLAQGFNPGYGVLIGCALKGHRTYYSTLRSRIRSGATVRAHPNGTVYPGLKPWAKSYRPFGAEEDGLPRRFVRRSFSDGGSSRRWDHEDSLSDEAFCSIERPRLVSRRSRKDDSSGGRRRS